MNGNIYYHTVDLFLGGIFVLFYAGQRFNTPSTNRSSTTAARYFVALFLYCLCGMVFYGTLVNFPHLLTFVMQGNTVESWAQGMSVPLLVALLLTVMLPKVPLLSTLDEWVCQKLKDMAAIPWEIMRLSAEMGRDKLNFSEEEQATVRQELEDAGFDPKDIVFAANNSPASVWTNLTAVLHKMDDWETDRRMGKYLAGSRRELEKLQDRHQCLFVKAKTCFHLLSKDADGGSTGKTHEAMIRYREDFMERVGQLRHDTLDFIARGVLHAELTDHGRETRLKSLGFSIDWPDPPFSLNQLMMLFVVMCGVVLSGFVVFKDNLRGLSFELVVTRSIMISVIYMVSVACAVLPKTRWNLAKTNAKDVRPIAFYLVAGLMAAAITQFTSLSFNVILTSGFSCSWQRFQLTYPWLLVSFCTALMTAVMSDNPRFGIISRWQQRCLEGLVQGGVMFLVARLTYFWLQQRFYTVVPTCDLKYQLPQRLTMMLMAGAMGVVIGFFIPTWYRERQEASAKESKEKLGLANTQPSSAIISV
jgi:hypothetical protein